MRHVVREFVAHYMSERYHQGIGSKLIKPGVQSANDKGPSTAIRCRSRLGGLLNFYHREAA
jgi:putative transposase